MNKFHTRRLWYIGLFALGLSLATGLILFALQQNIHVFFTPSQLLASTHPTHYHFRLGGLVKKNSVKRETEGVGVTFLVTDLKKEILVRYNGILPDLFREGKGVIAEGTLCLPNQPLILPCSTPYLL